MLDFYVVVSGYDAAYGKGWPALLNRLLPPNVYPFATDGVAAKYAVLDRVDFTRLCSAATRNPAVWARFAQPSRLVWARDDACRSAVVAAVVGAAPALLGSAVPMLAGPVTPSELWQTALALTFATELRAEPPGRGATILAADPARYAAFTGPALAAAGVAATRDGERFVLPASDRRRASRDWARRRRQGKLLSTLRLLKAAATYDAGLDYLAAKIERHSGVPVHIAGWHRRWPLLGGLALLPRLLWKGAVR